MKCRNPSPYFFTCWSDFRHVLQVWKFTRRCHGDHLGTKSVCVGWGGGKRRQDGGGGWRGIRRRGEGGGLVVVWKEGETEGCKSFPFTATEKNVSKIRGILWRNRIISASLWSRNFDLPGLSVYFIYFASCYSNSNTQGIGTAATLFPGSFISRPPPPRGWNSRTTRMQTRGIARYVTHFVHAQSPLISFMPHTEPEVEESR